MLIHYVNKERKTGCGYNITFIHNNYMPDTPISSFWEDVTCPECLKHKPQKDSLDKKLDIFQTIPTQLHVKKKGSKAFVRVTKEERGALIEFFDGSTFIDSVVPITAEEWPHVRDAIDQLIGGNDE